MKCRQFEKRQPASTIGEPGCRRAEIGSLQSLDRRRRCGCFRCLGRGGNPRKSTTSRFMGPCGDERVGPKSSISRCTILSLIAVLPAIVRGRLKSPEELQIMAGRIRKRVSRRLQVGALEAFSLYMQRLAGPILFVRGPIGISSKSTSDYVNHAP
jgi:hypothetical protein